MIVAVDRNVDPVLFKERLVREAHALDLAPVLGVGRVPIFFSLCCAIVVLLSASVTYLEESLGVRQGANRKAKKVS